MCGASFSCSSHVYDCYTLKIFTLVIGCQAAIGIHVLLFLLLCHDCHYSIMRCANVRLYDNAPLSIQPMV